MAYNKVNYIDGVTPLNANTLNKNENATEQLASDVQSLSNAIVQVDNKINNKSDVNHTHSDLHTHSNKSTLDGITSSKINEWNNKSNFDGNYNSLTNKPNIPVVDVTKNYVDTELSKKANAVHTHSEYTTENKVSTMIAEAQLGGGEVDLSGYATKEELKTKSDIGHLHSYNDLTNKPTIPTVDVSKAYVDTELSKKANTSHTHTKANITDFSHRHNANEIDGLPTGSNITVENNLTSTSTTNALAAAQGKVLDDKITVLSKKLPDLGYMTLSNAGTYLNIPTYDGSNQCVHSKVLYFENGWNGYKFWMAFTPLPYYPAVNENVENPSIVVSNDGVKWFVPPGLTNPLDDIVTPNAEYNSDTHLVLVGDTMEIWYRHFNKDPKVETIYKKTSNNGIDWSDRVQIVKSDGTEKAFLSPVVIHDEGIYKIWFIGTDNGAVYDLRYYESSNGVSLNFKRKMQLSDVGIWHHDIIKTKYGYELVANVGNRQSCVYSRSKDNITWESCTTILNVGASYSWDSEHLYRPSLTLVGDDYYFYYTGRNDKVTGAKQGLIIVEGANENIVVQSSNVIESSEKQFISKSLYDKIKDLDVESILNRIDLIEEALQSGGQIVNVSSVSLDKSSLSLKVGGKYTLVPTIQPNNATNKHLTWSSSNESVATVGSDGLVTTAEVGTSTITATSHNGISSTCTVSVTNDSSAILDPSVDGYMPVLLTGQEIFNQVGWNNNATSDYILYTTPVSSKIGFHSTSNLIQDMTCNKLDIKTAQEIYGSQVKGICGTADGGNNIQLKIPFSEVGGRNLQDFRDYISREEILVRAKCITPIKKITLTGSESWTIPGWVSSTAKCIQFETTLTNSNIFISQNAMSVFCNDLPTYKSSTTTESKEREGIMVNIYQANNLLILSLDRTKLATQDVVGLKNYLSSNNIDIFIAQDESI